MAQLSKTDLTKRLADKTGKSHKEAGESLSAVLEVITEALGAGDEVRLVGFGAFQAKLSAERVGVNPATKAKITIPAKMRVSFAAGKELQEAVAALKN